MRWIVKDGMDEANEFDSLRICKFTCIGFVDMFVNSHEVVSCYYNMANINISPLLVVSQKVMSNVYVFRACLVCG